ncbi:MAG: TolC family protein [Candidatus Cryptobacteroides sp.]
MSFLRCNLNNIIILLSVCCIQVSAQNVTLSEAISAARTNSVEAKEARQSFISAYWAYRSYKASRLPSFNLYGGLMNFDRSLTLMQSYEDGSFNYVSSYNLQNSLGLMVKQNITFTGGTLSVYSDLSRIDQFGMNRKLTWYSQPITVSYNQPLFTYNQFKWDKMIEPKEYERGKRRYMESMEQITINTVRAYYSLLLARMNNDIASSNYANTRKMLSVARERQTLGSVTRDEVLQLELRMLNDSISINETAVAVREAQMSLNSILGYDESFEITPVLEESLPVISMDYDFVIAKALDNSTFKLENEINLLNAESSVARAKASRGISMSLNARFGLSQTAPEFAGVYSDLLDQEVVGLSFSVPIFDWGLGKGKVQKARAAQEVARAQAQQSENDYRRKIFTAVGQFNNQRNQCSVSRRAMQIAQERYQLMMEKFRSGKASVMELNTAQSENDTALQKYITDVSNFWEYYYTLRQYTLYDFVKGEDLEIDVNEMIQR